MLVRFKCSFALINKIFGIILQYSVKELCECVGSSLLSPLNELVRFSYHLHRLEAELGPHFIEIK